MQKITPFLWFDTQAEEAMNYYCSIFKNAKSGHVTRNGDSVMMCSFELERLEFMALNGGPLYHFTEAISLYVDCETQAEVDELWEKLSAGGEKGKCGWLKDKFGLSWQIIPKQLGELMQSADAQKAGRVMQAMLKMDKIIIADLENAAKG